MKCIPRECESLLSSSAVIWVSNSSFPAFDFHLRKFKKFIIKKVYFQNQTCQHSTWQWLVVEDSPRGQLGPGFGQARIHTGFHRFTEIGRIFHNKYIFSNKNAEIFKLKSGKCWTLLASYPLQYIKTDLREIIWGFARLHLRIIELASIQNPLERGL